VLRLALREIRNHPRFAAFFVLNLGLGFAGFVGLDAFEASISKSLTSRSRAFLGADIDVTATRNFTEAEVRALDTAVGPATLSEATVLFSMAGAQDRARLVEVYAIDAVYPLYGQLRLEEGAVTEMEHRKLRERHGVWIDGALLSQLDVGLGESIQVGATRFEVQGVVSQDAGRATGSFSIAPRIYLAGEHLPATGLVALGSRVQYRRLYRLAADADSEAIAGVLREVSDDPRLSVRTHREATAQLSRVYAAVSDYLGLVALIAIFLAGVGTAHLFRAHLARRAGDLAILLSLGATRRRAQGLLLLQLVLLSVAAATLAIALGTLLLPALASLAGDFLPRDFEPRVGPRTAALVLALAVFGSTAACLPLLAGLRRLRPAELFAEHPSHSLGRGPIDLLWLLPALLVFWALAIWRTGSPVAGSVFSGVFVASLLVLVGLGWVLLRGLSRLPARKGLATRLALRELSRGRASTLASFVALALCALLIGIAPQLRGALERNLEAPEAGMTPSLFLFDIQPDQVDGLRSHVESEGTRLQRLSPMVRARLDSINGSAPGNGETAAGEGQRLRTRRYNLTFRQDLTPSEILREGSVFSGVHDPESDALPELSIETDFARRLGIGVGDRLGFDVQGVPIEGQVVNLRDVRWNTLQPNFFVLFQPGVLEEAPQTWLASIPELPTAEREALQASMTASFPNVSSIDVTKGVERMLGLIGQLQRALATTATLSILVGLVLVYAVARDQARERRIETNLLKILGAEFGRIRAATDLEFVLLGFLGASAGSGLAVAASALLCHTLLDTEFSVRLAPLFGAALAIPTLCVVTGRLATAQVLRERPGVLLQSSAD
jgi:putative ABC transport system permease protein